MRRTGALLGVMATVVVAGCSPKPAESGAATVTATVDATMAATTPSTDAPPALVAPDGFDRVRATVTAADGTECELCLWLAETGDQRSRGLMFVTDLGAADGMAFVYPAPHSGNFWMKNTLLPLSIAFFDPVGAYLDAFDMEPCTVEPCDLYPTPDDFLVAIETEQGDLVELGIARGSRLDLTDLPCP